MHSKYLFLAGSVPYLILIHHHVQCYWLCKECCTTTAEQNLTCCCLAWSKICTRGDRWEQFLSSTNCMSLKIMAKLLWYLMDRVWQHAPKTLHIWDELAAKSGLQCISLSLWPFDPKRKSFCPTKRASICSLQCFLQFRGCEVHQAKADADLLIEQTTASSVANHEKLIFLWF